MAVPRIVAGTERRSSSRDGQRLPTIAVARGMACCSRFTSTCATPNRPMARVTKPMPSDSSGMPKV